jgi:hypothetical protein
MILLRILVTITYFTVLKSKPVREITINGKIKRVPTAWNELNKNQFKVYINAYYLIRNQIYTKVPGEKKNKARIAADVHLLQQSQQLLTWALLGISWRTFTRLTREQVYELIYTLKLTDFLLLGNQLTTNLLPVISRWWARPLFGPADNFNNIKGNEFTFIDLAYKNYKKTGKIYYLNLFVAILYRYRRSKYEIVNPAWDGDLRQPFNNKTVEKRLPIVNSLPLDIKTGVLLWYEGCVNQLKKDYPEIYEGGTGARNMDLASFDDIIIESAGARFGDYRQTCDTELRKLLRAICQQIKQNRELELKYKK